MLRASSLSHVTLVSSWNVKWPSLKLHLIFNSRIKISRRVFNRSGVPAFRQSINLRCDQHSTTHVAVLCRCRSANFRQSSLVDVSSSVINRRKHLLYNECRVRRTRFNGCSVLPLALRGLSDRAMYVRSDSTEATPSDWKMYFRWAHSNN